MKRLPHILPLLILVALVGGCGQFKGSVPQTPIQTVAALNQTYTSTLNTIERLHDFGYMTDAARLALQTDIDQAETWRLALNAAALAGSQDEPFSDYRRALERFNEYFDNMVRAQIEAERAEKTVKRVKVKPSPQASPQASPQPSPSQEPPPAPEPQ